MRWATRRHALFADVCPAHAQSYRTQSIDDARPHDRTPFEHSAAESFGIKPVVMKRSIPDMLCSYADMLETEADIRRQLQLEHIVRCAHRPKLLRLDADERLDFSSTIKPPGTSILRLLLRADRNKSLPVHWTVYDAFRSDPVHTIAGILDFYGLSDRAFLSRKRLLKRRPIETLFAQ